MTTYIIKKTDSNTLCQITDGTADTTSSSLTLFGKNYAGYGPQLDENLVKLLENFSFSLPPQHPIQGQLWWDSSEKVLKVFRSSDWKVISGPHNSGLPPTTPQVGDLWWDSTTKQLKVYNGSGWIVVGPIYEDSHGVSGVVPVKVTTPTPSINPIVLKFLVRDVLVAVLSNSPTFTTNDLPGFPEVKPGFNLPVLIGKYHGDSENALSLGNVLAANYLRSDIISTTNFKFNVRSNDGLNVGLNDDLSISVGTTAVKITNNTLGRDTEFYSKGSSGVPILALKIDTGTGVVSVPSLPTTNTAVANKIYVDSSISTASENYLLTDGSNLVKGSIVPDYTNVYSIGSATTKFKDIYSSQVFCDTITATNANFTSITVLNDGTDPTSVVTKKYVDDADAAIVSSTDGKLGTLKTQILGNSPLSMPMSTLQALSQSIGHDTEFAAHTQTALNTKAPLDSPVLTGNPIATTVLGYTDTSNRIATTAFVQAVAGRIQDLAGQDLTAYARIANPTFTGTPKAPTMPATDTSTTLATTEFVKNAITNLIGAAPAALDTLAELSQSLGNDANFAANLTNTLATKAPIANPTLSGVTSVSTLQVGTSIQTPTSGTIDIGTQTNQFRTIYGTSMRANYADLAENYVADAYYEPGTVLDFGGDKEVTLSSGKDLSKVAGVVSSNPAYLMNSECKGEFVVALALQGRVPCKVIGQVAKGDLLVSYGGGVARRHLKPDAGTLIGKALETHAGEESLIEIVVGRC